MGGCPTADLPCRMTVACVVADYLRICGAGNLAGLHYLDAVSKSDPSFFETRGAIPRSTRGAIAQRYCALRPLRNARKPIHLGVSPNSPANHKTKPANPRIVISPNSSSSRTTHVD